MREFKDSLSGEHEEDEKAEKAEKAKLPAE
jgi:hypothetical protein